VCVCACVWATLSLGFFGPQDVHWSA